MLAITYEVACNILKEVSNIREGKVLYSIYPDDETFIVYRKGGQG